MSLGNSGSLRRRLLVLALGGTLFCWVAVALFSYEEAHHEIDELFDAQLAQAAQTLLAVATVEEDMDDDMAGEVAGSAHEYQRNLRFQLWDRSGRLLLRSANAPSTPMAAHEGFSDAPQGGERWHYLSVWDPDHKFRVQVGESHKIRDELTSNIVWRLMSPILVMLPVLAAGLWIAIGRALRPLEVVTGHLGRLDPEDLQPIEDCGTPTEIRPLVEALNHLLGRVSQALEHERRFTADAAHELRTPLATLKAQVHVALRATDEAQRRAALEQLRAGVDRGARLVDQLLTLARLDPARPPGAAGAEPASGHASTAGSGPLDLSALAQEVCAEQGAAALARHQNLELDAEAPAWVSGRAELLHILLRNLMDNAIRYTPEGGSVTVRVEPGTTVRLEVVDTGPGIPEAQRDFALQRFHRLSGQDTEGSGLGLSIVQRIVELHDAHLRLGMGTHGQGLRVEVDFPAAGRGHAPLSDPSR
ncbi:MAG: sensor histidine kinase N-terminal domain-containing protein [Betaproteobacteria bacterium]|nr:sensor histidine kinase N-terminal domain-containing protein [Betaproteobacteria bacterium]